MADEIATLRQRLSAAEAREQTLRGLLREAYRALREVQFDDEWMTRVRAALETSQ